MDRRFNYQFQAVGTAGPGPVPGNAVDLGETEIEDAALRECFQTSNPLGASWLTLSPLLTSGPAGTPFVFAEPLGHAREVKVALSGLFGRFVARAYLERYFGLSVFVHLGHSSINLAGSAYQIQRISSGDLPDWVACTAAGTDITVAEAKGCHNPTGPLKTLDRAWSQAQRVNVIANGAATPVKRIAIATRWGIVNTNLAVPHLFVRDPLDDGDPATPDQRNILFMGMLRLHLASLIRPLGYRELATTLTELATRGTQVTSATRQAAHAQLASAHTWRSPRVPPRDGMIGGIITTSGPIVGPNFTIEDQVQMLRLGMRPAFVGVDRAVVAAALDGDPTEARGRMQEVGRGDGVARGDGAGTLIIRLNAQEHVTDETGSSSST